MRAATQKKIETIRNKLYGYYEMLSELSAEIEEQAGDCPDTEKGEARREALEEESGAVSELADSLYNVVDEIDGQLAA